MAVTDTVLYFTVYTTHTAINPWVYASFLINVLLGRLLCRTESPLKIGGVTVLASVQFFLVTNFGVWAAGELYPMTLEGLLTCYTLALPFASRDMAPPFGFTGNQLFAEVIFAGLLFAAHAVLSRVAFPRERVLAAAGTDGGAS
jgi:hypothetical protein